eukprot:TRINITY_DN1345_c0_g1_i2.p1 TRINITY_DN1345_c0_g1~~TRINITY_DN1345_c0_g1_i2.p1  ORF type:complete len:160 (-),score=53.59 TRINITY_DN1345_c0_g1_i2:156-635(-)
MCIRDRYQRRVRAFFINMAKSLRSKRMRANRTAQREKLAKWNQKQQNVVNQKLKEAIEAQVNAEPISEESVQPKTSNEVVTVEFENDSTTVPENTASEKKVKRGRTQKTDMMDAEDVQGEVNQKKGNKKNKKVSFEEKTPKGITKKKTHVPGVHRRLMK